MKKFFLLLIIILLSSCAISNKKEQRQDIVSEQEIELMSHIRSGMYYFKQSKYWDAVSSFEKALMIKRSSDIQYNLALAYERLGDNDKALAIMLNLYLEYPFDINYKMAYARMLDLMGSRENAISIYMESLAFLNDLNDTKNYKYKIYRRLSDLYFKMGEEDEATCYAKMALESRNTVDETLRFNRFLLSVNKEEEFVRNFENKQKVQKPSSDDSLFHEELDLQQNQNEQDYNEDNENEVMASDEMSQEEIDNDLLSSVDPKVNDCKFQNVFAWDLFYNIKQNNQKIVQVVDMSSQCLSNKDEYYPVFLVMKQIIKEYQKSLYGNTQQNRSFFDIFKEEQDESVSISDSTFLLLPNIAYPYLAYYFKNYGVAKNGSIN